MAAGAPSSAERAPTRVILNPRFAQIGTGKMTDTANHTPGRRQVHPHFTTGRSGYPTMTTPLEQRIEYFMEPTARGFLPLTARGDYLVRVTLASHYWTVVGTRRLGIARLDSDVDLMVAANPYIDYARYGFEPGDDGTWYREHASRLNLCVVPEDAWVRIELSYRGALNAYTTDGLRMRRAQMDAAIAAVQGWPDNEAAVQAIKAGFYRSIGVVLTEDL